MTRFKYTCLLFSACFTLWIFPAESQKVDSWLLLGPVPPLFDQAEPQVRDQEMEQNAAIAPLLTDNWPSAGTALQVFGETYTWAPFKGTSFEKKGTYALSTRIELDGYSSGRLSLALPTTPRVFLNGDSLSPEAGTSFVLNLIPGSHHLLLVFELDGTAPETAFSATWLPDEGGGAVAFHVEDRRRLNQKDVVDVASISQLSLSAKGRLAYVQVRDWDRKNNKTQRHMLIMEGANVHQKWLENGPRDLVWSPDAAHRAYRIGDDLWLERLADGKTRRLLAAQEGLGDITWHPSGQSLLVSITKDHKPRPDGMKHYQNLEDRWTYWRDEEQVYQVDIHSGWLRRISHGPASTSLLDVSPDGKYALLMQSIPDVKTLQYARYELIQVNLESGAQSELGTFETMSLAVYGWDGSIYMVAGPNEFDGLGSTVVGKGHANDYDGQLYVLDAQGKNPVALSKDFDPGIDDIRRAGNLKDHFLVQVREGTQNLLYLFDARKKHYQLIAPQGDVVRAWAVSPDGDQLIWATSSRRYPQKVFQMTLPSGKPRPILNPHGSRFDQVQLGEVKAFPVTLDNGVTIDGHYYLPPNFDPDKKYPTLVYYYGGTWVAGAGFGGRYPYNWWAACGYVVYVLQPSGAVGYGQAFSAKHVNAWGRPTAQDIIASVQKFSAQHAFVDKDKIGCLGASYGGFMTMYLLTQTKMFSAAVSHAGISALTGYWGEGWWGYAYNSVAAFGSMPWSHRNLYVEQSPIYHADRIETPLLLLHGEADTNVPIGESHNMFTALRLLERDVEMVSVAGQDHHILDRDKRLVWGETILAWFEWKLKGNKSWWQKLYP